MFPRILYRFSVWISSRGEVGGKVHWCHSLEFTDANSNFYEYYFTYKGKQQNSIDVI
jgi:hypothetical protein